MEWRFTAPSPHSIHGIKDPWPADEPPFERPFAWKIDQRQSQQSDQKSRTRYTRERQHDSDDDDRKAENVFANKTDPANERMRIDPELAMVRT